jgi:Putative polyhydroxyalkanoic acid system protein (PHA_gran_rgn)
MDIEYLLQPGRGHVCSAFAPGKQTGTMKVPLLDQQNFAAGFLSNHQQLHAVELERRICVMTAPLVVSIPHRLGRDEAVRRLKSGLTRAASSIPVLKVDEERWDGDRMMFRVRALGQAASGHIDVADDHVRLEVTLPWLLQRFAEVAQIAIRNRGNLLLTKRS